MSLGLERSVGRPDLLEGEAEFNEWAERFTLSRRTYSWGGWKCLKTLAFFLFAECRSGMAGRQGVSEVVVRIFSDIRGPWLAFRFLTVTSAGRFRLVSTRCQDSPVPSVRCHAECHPPLFSQANSFCRGRR